MRLLRVMAYFFLITLVTACNARTQPAPVTSSVVDNMPATPSITEYAALQLLLEALEQRQVATDCLGFRSENNTADVIAQDWEFAAIEIHDEICGGDPYVGHVRNRYRISSDGSLMKYNVRDAEYVRF